MRTFQVASGVFFVITHGGTIIHLHFDFVRDQSWNKTLFTYNKRLQQE